VLSNVLGWLQMVRFLDGLLKMTYDLWQPSLSGLGMSQCYGTGTLSIVVKPQLHIRKHFPLPQTNNFLTAQIRLAMQLGPRHSIDSKVFCPIAEQQSSQNEVASVVTWADDFALLQDMLCSGLL